MVAMLGPQADAQAEGHRRDDLFILRGVPGHIRSDNGPEFVAKAVREWIAAVGAKTAYIAPGSPWENGYIESFNARYFLPSWVRSSTKSILPVA